MCTMLTLRYFRFLGSNTKCFKCIKPQSNFIRFNNGSAMSVLGSISGRTMSDDEIEKRRSIISYDREVNQVKVCYEKTGMGKQVVLLLPGAIGSSRTDFLPQLENLNKDLFTVIGWDPPGYGHSRPPERSWPPNFFHRDADTAAKLMQAVKLDQAISYEKYSLLGWSDGGITALIMAAKFPEAVNKLVVWGANSYVTKEETEIYEQIRDVSAWSEKMRQPFIDLYGEVKFQQLWNEWIDAILCYAKDSNGNFCDELLGDIKCPTLIIHGQKDAMVPQFHADHLHDKIKNSRLINYPDGKHNLHFKYYKEFNSHVENFLLEPHENVSKM